MKKKVFIICLLLMCVPLFCIEEFWDGADQIGVDYHCKKNDWSPNWVQVADDTLFSMFSALNFESHSRIDKLSKDDVRLINKALQKFEVAKDEIYGIKIYSAIRLKFFFVLITDVKGENCQWECVGRWARY